MKAFLSLGIPIWFGWGAGAVTDDRFSSFWAIWALIGVFLALMCLAYLHAHTKIEDGVFLKTLIVVVATGLLSFFGAIMYDQFAGGPDARDASVENNLIFKALQDQQEEDACVASYTLAEDVSQATLIIRISEATGNALSTGVASQPYLDRLNDAIKENRFFLDLRRDIDVNCDPNRKDGMKLLPDELRPELPQGD